MAWKLVFGPVLHVPDVLNSPRGVRLSATYCRGPTLSDNIHRTNAFFCVYIFVLKERGHVKSLL